MEPEKLPVRRLHRQFVQVLLPLVDGAVVVDGSSKPSTAVLLKSREQGLDEVGGERIGPDQPPCSGGLSLETRSHGAGTCVSKIWLHRGRSPNRGRADRPLLQRPA